VIPLSLLAASCLYSALIRGGRSLPSFSSMRFGTTASSLGSTADRDLCLSPCTPTACSQSANRHLDIVWDFHFHLGLVRAGRSSPSFGSMTLDITASSLESTTLPLGLQIHNLLQSYQQVLSHWWRCPVLEVAQSLLSGLIASLSGQALHAISGHFTHSSAHQVIPSCQSLNVDELLHI